MKKALECGRRFFPPDAKLSEVLQPGDSALDGLSLLLQSQSLALDNPSLTAPIGRSHPLEISGRSLLHSESV
jgi:hypothetical protein